MTLRLALVRFLLALPLALVPCVAGAQAQPAPKPPQALPEIPLKIGRHALTAEVANTVPTRTIGLMHRFSLKPDHGMLFVFREPQPLAFWMKNTYVALSIAYIDAAGRILNVEDMAPQTEETHLSAGPALYALEMKKGWFAERGIGPGARIEGLERAPRANE